MAEQSPSGLSRFDLAHAVRAWRQRLLTSRMFDPETVDELESHVLDAVERAIAEGCSEETAFVHAVEQIGGQHALEEAFREENKNTTRRRARPRWQHHPLVPIMIANYWTVARRNLKRQFGYTFINVVGLAFGLACCAFVALYVLDETSYDRFHTKADRIYRVHLDAVIAGNEFAGPISPVPLGRTLAATLPEVETATVVSANWRDATVRYDNRTFSESNFFLADSAFFKVFDFPLLHGDPATALAAPNTVVLTESTARKYFGDADPIGQTLQVNGRLDYTVTGIVADPPAQSHFHFDFLGAIETMYRLQPQQVDMWVSNNHTTYLLLRPGTDPAMVDAKIADLVRGHVSPQIKELMGVTLDEFFASGGRYEYHLQPLTDIHLHPFANFEFEPQGDARYVYIFTIVAFFLLLIACINFMNLATARSANRAKEVGIRKTLGSNRGQLIRQFLFESVFMTALAFVLAFVLMALLRPLFNDLAGKTFSFGLLANPVVWLWIVAFVLLVGLLAGLYPALYLASFRPATVLKGKLKAGMKSGRLRTVLVVFQFSISIVLLIGTMVVGSQLRYVQHKNLGFDKEQVVIIEDAYQLREGYEPFMNTLRQHPGIRHIAGADGLPGRLNGNTAYLPEGRPGTETQALWYIEADEGLAEALGLTLAEGRYFSPDRAGDARAVVVNEAVARAFGWGDDALGQALTGSLTPTGFDRYEVIGVVKDFHFQSLHAEIQPLVLHVFEPEEHGTYAVIRLAEGDPAPVLRDIKQTWKQLSPDQPFRYTFMDDDFAARYAAEQQVGQLFATFAGIAIFIACLGLFGLAAFAAEQRRKEIGVRKVMGATVTSLVLLLSRDFTRYVLIAFVVAAPVAWYAMSRWLEDFAYRTALSPWTFLLAGLAALVVAWLTVSYQALKAAHANPANVLRYE